MYMLAEEGLLYSRDMAFATGAILIIVVFLVNYATTKFAGQNREVTMTDKIKIENVDLYYGEFQTS